MVTAPPKRDGGQAQINQWRLGMLEFSFSQCLESSKSPVVQARQVLVATGSSPSDVSSIVGCRN